MLSQPWLVGTALISLNWFPLSFSLIQAHLLSLKCIFGTRSQMWDRWWLGWERWWLLLQQLWTWHPIQDKSVQIENPMIKTAHYLSILYGYYPFSSSYPQSPIRGFCNLSKWSVTPKSRQMFDATRLGLHTDTKRWIQADGPRYSLNTDNIKLLDKSICCIMF